MRVALQANLQEDPWAREQQGGGGTHVTNVLHGAFQLALGVQLASRCPNQVETMTPSKGLRVFWKPRPDRLQGSEVCGLLLQTGCGFSASGWHCQRREALLHHSDFFMVQATL